MAKGGARQIAALPWRKTGPAVEILLITSRETKRWVIPKGWPMKHLQDYNAARQEAFEEAGLQGHMQRRVIGSFSYEKLAGGNSTKLLRVDVFALKVTAMLPSWPEKGQRDRKWFKPIEAAQWVNETELKSLILGFAAKQLK
jgi:8-oxo-dGTP pyrophosphatase MutT (NUDIX family)